MTAARVANTFVSLAAAGTDLLRRWEAFLSRRLRNLIGNSFMVLMQRPKEQQTQAKQSLAGYSSGRGRMPIRILRQERERFGGCAKGGLRESWAEGSAGERRLKPNARRGVSVGFGRRSMAKREARNDGVIVFWL